jgi:hypothetical protein
MTTKDQYGWIETSNISKLQSDSQDAAGIASSRVHFAKYISTLFIALFVVSIPYLSLTKTSFVGYDDFNNLYRAAFEDTRQPSVIFTTPHFKSTKYRPLDRAIIFITYHLGHGTPMAFRSRNLFFHLLNCSAVFGLGMLLFDSVFIGALGASLFGLNPLAHQAVAGAVWTNTAAASMTLIAVVLGLLSYRATDHALRWLILAIIPVWIGVFIYEPVVVAPVIVFLYFALDTLFLRRIHVGKSWVWTLLLLSAAVVGSMVVLRAIVMPGVYQPAGSPAAIAKNATLYVIALLLPVDPLLLNQWFKTPLVSEVPLERVSTQLIKIAVVCSVVILAFLFFFFRHAIRRHVSSLCSLPRLFLFGATCLSILPLLLFNDHASETYLYVPVAFFMLLLASILSDLRHFRTPIFYMIAALLFASFGCADWGRSQRVIRSAAIAQRILSGLPVGSWRQGEWRIRLATAPGYPLPHRYGLYSYAGLDTIGTGTGNGILAVQHALQLQTGNEQGVFVDVLTADQMSQACNPAKAMIEPCYWVYPDGHVEQFFGGLVTNPSEPIRH